MKDFIKKELREGLENQVLYCAVVLDEKGKSILASHVAQFIPEDWKPIMHHMTIGFKKSLTDLDLGDEEGKLVELTVTHLGISDMVMAVKVEGFPSLNEIPHITVAINADAGGKAVMSNQITDWKEVEPFTVTGVVSNLTN